jgi:Spy/CpxP family protein refolding chaperone
MLTSKLSAGIYLVMVFLSGILVGGFSYRAYTVSTASAAVQAPRNPDDWRRRWMDEMRARVKLDDRQVAEVQQILDDTRGQFDEIHKRSKAESQALQASMQNKIRGILREDQRPLYDQFRAEREKMRHREQGDGPGKK